MSDSTGRVILIGCVAQKSDCPMPAKDLYTSNLFRARRVYAEASGRPWSIVSAEFPGILHPDAVTAPYNRRITELTPMEHRIWRDCVQRRAIEDFGDGIKGATVEVHAGAPYVEALTDALVSRFGLTIEAPLAGLFIGQQLAWYKARRPS